MNATDSIENIPQDQYLHRTWIETDAEALEHNARLIRSMLGGTGWLAVVKADAYGHGADTVAPIFERCGADWFGVSNLEEAIALRKCGVSRPILILGTTPPEYAALMNKDGITQTVYSAEYAKMLSDEAVRRGVELDVHIKLDTGMGRIGFRCSDGEPADIDAIEAACRLPGLSATGIFMHFPSADEDSPDAKRFTRRQFELFNDVIDRLERRGIRFALRHCCNSAGMLYYPEFHLDMVRPGIIQYGIFPGKPLPELGFRPAMQLRTVISMVKTIPAGEPVSYGRTYYTDKPTVVATAAIGYADGYFRCLSGRAHMLVRGKPAPVIGRVCMDQLMLDVTGIDGVREGDVATVFGRDGGAELTADTLAELAGTVSYEIITRIGKRVPQVLLAPKTPRLRLVRLEEKYRRHLTDMLDEWSATGERIIPYAIRKNDWHDFDSYLALLDLNTDPALVPETTLFCLDEERDIFVGAVSIRHYLTDSLLRCGGHIGDGVRPSERRRGIATRMIGLALDECRRLGLDRVLMTCDRENTGSAKSIIKNGGALENEIPDGSDGRIVQRYWIDLE